MARKQARRKAGTRRAPRKRATSARGRSAARAKRGVRRARPRKAAAKTRARATRSARKAPKAKRATVRRKPKPAPSTIGQTSLGVYTTPPPISPIEPARHDPWDRPVGHHTEDSGMEDDEESEEPM